MKRSFCFSPSHIVLMVLCFLLLGVGHLPAQLVNRDVKITNYFPTSGRQGDTITFLGTGFLQPGFVHRVHFGNTQFPSLSDLPIFPAASFTTFSDTLVKAVLGAGGSNSVQVIVGNKQDQKPFNFVEGPFLFDYRIVLRFTTTPQFFNGASKGDTVVITCDGATDVTNIALGGVSAVFTVIAPNTIKAVVGTGATGSVSVTKPIGTSICNGFVYGPTITDFSPTSAKQGDIVTINGFGFQKVNNVKFGSIDGSGVIPAASFTIISPTKIEAVVGIGATGSVFVSTSVFNSRSFNTSKSGFTFLLPVPIITGFFPTSAKTGDTVTIQGSFINTVILSQLTVKLGGVPAVVVGQESGLVKVVVGAGATGDVSLTNPNGTATKAGFTFLSPPTITNFSPTCANTGDTVSISGTFLTNPAYVLFGGIPATAIIPVSSTLVKAVVGAGASGNVQIVTLGGTATKAGFTFGSRPIVSTILPTFAKTGDTVKILGSGLNAVSTITFGGVPATAIIPISSAFVKAVVGAGASGIVAVTTPCGTAGKSGFTFISPPPLLPIITSFKESVRHGDTLSIHGQHLSNTNSVTLAGIPQQQIINISDSLIKVVVVSAADRRLKNQGAVCVTTIVGTVCTAGGSFGITCPPATCIAVCPPSPITTRVTPTDVNQGDTLFIEGTELLGVSRIYSEAVFSPNSPSANSIIIPIPSFQIISNSLIKAVVNNGISGELIVDGDCDFRTPVAKITMLTPYIHSISEYFAGSGDTVRIIGDFFGGPTSVRFGGKEAASFSFVVDPNSSQPHSFGTITAIVGEGASGDVAVSTPTGTRKISGFTFLSTFTAKAPKNSDEQSLLKKSATPSEESLTVYPNPATNTVTIETILKSNENAAEVILSDVLGNRLWSSRETPQGGKLSKQIDLSHYTPGIYRVEVIGITGERRTARVMKR